MRSIRTLFAGACLAGSLFVAAACSDDDNDNGGNPSPTEPAIPPGDTPTEPGSPTGGIIRLTGVLPRDGTFADSVERVQVTFSGPLARGSEDYVDIHQGSTRGEVVPALCSMSSQATIINCAPAGGFVAGTEYWIHVGGGLRGFNGRGVDLASVGTLVGGTIVSDTAFVAGVHPTATDGTGGSWVGDSTSRAGLVVRRTLR